MSQGAQGEFPEDLVWQIITQLAKDQLDAGTDVQMISDKDFNQNGDLIMKPPSVRTFYSGTGFASTTDSQRLSYESVGRYILLCAAQDLRTPAAQALASLKMCRAVCRIFAGTRLVLPTDERSEPITLTALEPLPIAGIGVAYGVAIEVPGLAQFAGVNAAGYTAAGVTA